MLASGRGQSGRGIMCTVTSFVSCLFIFTSSQLHEFSVFFLCVQSLLSFPCTVRCKYLFISATHSLSWHDGQRSLDTACPLLLLCVRVISKNLMTL